MNFESGKLVRPSPLTSKVLLVSDTVMFYCKLEIVFYFDPRVHVFSSVFMHFDRLKSVIAA